MGNISLASSFPASSRYMMIVPGGGKGGLMDHKTLFSHRVLPRLMENSLHFSFWDLFWLLMPWFTKHPVHHSLILLSLSPSQHPCQPPFLPLPHTNTTSFLEVWSLALCKLCYSFWLSLNPLLPMKLSHTTLTFLTLHFLRCYCLHQITNCR